MSDVVKMIGTHLVADSRDLAEIVDVRHPYLFRLIREHLAAFQEFGTVCFENEPSKARGGGGDGERFAILNENQCYLLLTFVRNSKVTVPLKTRLIAAFSRAREELYRVRAQDQHVGLFLQEVPRNWQRRFQVSFFEAVMECYGIAYIRDRGTPPFVGHFINTYIYEPLLGNLSDELKAKRSDFCAENGKSESTYRLHQFLKEHCADSLERHVLTVETILRISVGAEDFKEHFSRRFEGRTQLPLEFQTKAQRRRIARRKAAVAK